MNDVQTSVLIVGGGVVGLSAALFLAAHDVPCVLVERHPDLLSHPRMRGLTPRSMELFRQAGLEQAIRSRAFGGPGFSWAPVLADTLDDETYQHPDEPEEDDGSSASPCSFGPIDQDQLEDLVRNEARARGADLRYHTEMRDVVDEASGVVGTAVHRSSGSEYRIRARYLVAADGAASPIRTRLGVAGDGPGALYSTITALVDADLTPALRGRRATIAYLNQPQPYTILMAHDDDGTRWVFGTGFDPRYAAIEDFTDARIVDMVRAAAGLPDVPVRPRPQIPGTDITVLSFPIGAQVVRDYRVGRVFLAGDAAHSVPPTGGLGANTGIQDAHNLAWKLAAVLDGRAGDALLDTYHDERRPVGMLVMGQALARFGARMGSDTDPGIIDYGAATMGYRYRSSAVLGADADGAPVLPRDLGGEPGTRAPHCEVTLDGRPISTVDLHGRGFVLLAGPDGAPWASAATELGIAAHRFGGDLAPVDALSMHGIGPAGALVIRPDGFVAWRSVGAATEPARELADVLSRVLSAQAAVRA